MYPAQYPAKGYVADYFARDWRRGPARCTWHIERYSVRNCHPPQDHFCIRKLVSMACTSSVLSLNIIYPHENGQWPERIRGELYRKMIDETDGLEEVLTTVVITCAAVSYTCWHTQWQPVRIYQSTSKVSWLDEPACCIRST